ncbi:MAG: phytoene/squalene synthase family protein [Calditrichaeota bacterium]|nr:MAG: phytoene/squalene synthase family protein [Calditrichota bacterium]
MKSLFDDVSYKSSKIVTHAYSTSFSLGIKCLHRSIHKPIYAIYGFVRLADEIVDSFLDFPRADILTEYKTQTYRAINQGISSNPVLNSFQETVNEYNVNPELIETFLQSMEMDLVQQNYTRENFDTYILGSAEVVGLMCLHVFCNGDKMQYERLRSPAMRLGAAFQKVNFLRDMKEDLQDLNRSYFPNVNFDALTDREKKEIEIEIAADFKASTCGIRNLPREARFGVYLAYVYYFSLFKMICRAPSEALIKRRFRLPRYKKIIILIRSYLGYRLGLV